jgi:hypothetical protein
MRGPAWPCVALLLLRFCVSARLYALLMLPHAVAASSRTLFVAVKGGQRLGGTARADRNGEDGVHAAWRGVSFAWVGTCVCESLRHYYNHAVSLVALLLRRVRRVRPKRRVEGDTWYVPHSTAERK